VTSATGSLAITVVEAAFLAASMSTPGLHLDAPARFAATRARAVLLREGDPMSDRVAEQIALGVSTRGYDRSLEPIDESIETRGSSKSNASRALIDATTEKLAQFVSRKLDDVDLVAMFIDGIEFAGHAVLIALGVTIDGTKTPLGIWAGSTENTVVVTELLSNLVGRGLRVEASMLFVIDGSKAIRKALRDVFGDRAVVQRCQVHKARNVRDHLSESRRAYVAKQMRDAYDSATATTARKKLMQLASWLDANGEDGAAASLREGLDETLTKMGTRFCHQRNEWLNDRRQGAIR
jgi:putative transposase